MDMVLYQGFFKVQLVQLQNYFLHFQHQIFNQIFVYVVFLLILQVFLHLTWNGYNVFNVIISPLMGATSSPSESFNLILSFFLYPFQF